MTSGPLQPLSRDAGSWLHVPGSCQNSRGRCPLPELPGVSGPLQPLGTIKAAFLAENMMQPGQEYTERENMALSLPELKGKLLHDAGSWLHGKPATVPASFSILKRDPWEIPAGSWLHGFMFREAARVSAPCSGRFPGVSAARTQREAATCYRSGGSMAGIPGPDSRIMHSYLSGFFAVVLKGTGYSENSPLGYRLNQPTNDLLLKDQQA